jgi:hypothetical protein
MAVIESLQVNEQEEAHADKALTNEELVSNAYDRRREYYEAGIKVLEETKEKDPLEALCHEIVYQDMFGAFKRKMDRLTLAAQEQGHEQPRKWPKWIEDEISKTPLTKKDFDRTKRVSIAGMEKELNKLFDPGTPYKEVKATLDEIMKNEFEQPIKNFEWQHGVSIVTNDKVRNSSDSCDRSRREFAKVLAQKIVETRQESSE